MAASKRRDNRGRLLRTGEGQRDDGRYYYRYNDLNGKRKMIYAMSLADLREQEKQIRRDLEDGIDSTKGEMSLNSAFDLYLSTKVNIKDSTRSTYLTTWIYVNESTLGEMSICDIRNSHILRFYAEMNKAGLAAGTQKNVHLLLHAVFAMAVKNDYIRKDPTTDAIKEISGPVKKVSALTRQQQATLLNFVQESTVYGHYEPLITVFLNTGLRESELCGLSWENVDFKENVIHVKQQLLYRDYGNGYTYHLQSLKTSSSECDIPITMECRKALQRQREFDMMLNIKRQEVEGIKNFVFINRVGMPYMDYSLNKAFKNIVNRYNRSEEKQARKENRDPVPLPHFTCHVLRHCFASRMAEAGIEAKTLQMLMGHSNLSTTMQIYVNLDFEEVKKQVANVEQYIKVV